jgi:phage regulator Rha-like protein
MNLITTTALTMSSQEIADLVGSRHDDVKRSIDRLVARGVVAQPPMADGQKAGNGVVVQEYLVNKRDSFVVVAQLSPEFTARLVDRWQELEAGLAPDLNTEEGKLVLIQEMAQKQLALIAENKLIAGQRDHAVATKAEIGSRREATAMSTASTMTRKVKKLEAELGRNQKHATVIAVERATDRKFPKNAYVAMRKWCRENGVSPVDVVDDRYGTVKAWPAGAWKSAHDIDLRKLFAAERKKAA